MRYAFYPLVFCCFISSVFAHSAHNETYYAEHPKALLEAIQSCPQNAPRDVSCSTLQSLAVEINEMVYELRISPQEFGKSILALQEKIAKEDPNAFPKGGESVLNKERNRDKKILRQRLAVVGWLESPNQ